MTHTPQPSATPDNTPSQVVDRLFRRWVSDPNNNGEYVLALNPAQTEAFFAYLRAVLEFQRDQWKLSSVCREKETEIVRLREEVNRLNGIITGPFAPTAALHELLDQAGCLSVSKEQYAKLHAHIRDLQGLFREENEHAIKLAETGEKQAVELAACRAQLAAVTKELDELRNNPAWLP